MIDRRYKSESQVRGHSSDRKCFLQSKNGYFTTNRRRGEQHNYRKITTFHQLVQFFFKLSPLIEKINLWIFVAIKMNTYLFLDITSKQFIYFSTFVSSENLHNLLWIYRKLCYWLLGCGETWSGAQWRGAKKKMNNKTTTSIPSETRKQWR